MSRKCQYFMCRSPKTQKKSMFRFPSANSGLLQTWIANCGNMTISHLSPEALRNRYICIDHFDKKFLEVMGTRIMLNREAVPEPYRWEDAPKSGSTSQGRVSPELRVLAPRKVYGLTRKQNGDDNDNIHNSPVGDEGASWRDDDSDATASAADDKDMVEVKTEPVEETPVIADNGAMVEVKAEPIDGEASRDPLDDRGLSPLLRERWDERVVVKIEQGAELEPVLKEEIIDFHEHPPEIQLDNYKALYFKMKDEMTRYKVETQRLADENKSLDAKNKNLTENIENLLKNNAQHSDNEAQELKLLKSSNRRLKALNSRLTKDIDALRIENQEQKKHIADLTELNTCLLQSARRTQKRGREMAGSGGKETDRGTKGSREGKVKKEK